MKRIVLLIMIVMLVVPTRGQRIRAYVLGGATASQIEGDELKGFKKWGVEAGVGALANLDNDGKWQLGVEMDFAQRGAFNNSGDPYNMKLTLNYVDVPLTVYFHDPVGGIMVGAGLVYGRLVQQPHDEMKYNPEYFIPDTTDMSFLKNDLAAAVELRFAIWRGLNISIRYQYSFIPIKRDWGFTEFEGSRAEGHRNNCYNSSAAIRLLWQFGDEDNYSHHRKGKRRRR